MDPNATPALAPPPGVQSNFVDPPGQMSSVIAGSVCILTVVTVVVALRTFTKVHVIRKVHIEDYLCVLAWALLVCYNGVVIYLGSTGFSRHQWDVNLTMLPGLLYWVNIAYILYGPTTAAAKLSVLYQIKRIFTTTRRDVFWYAVQISILLNGCFYFSVFLVFVFQCWPREAIWNMAVQGTCINSVAGDFASGIGNILSDLEALLLPAWAIWRLETQLKTKLSVFAVFGVGCVALVIGAVGIWIRVLVLTDPDFTWVGTQLAMLALAEIGIVIVVGCMPVLPRLFQWFDQKAKGLSAVQNHGTGASQSHSLVSSRLKRDHLAARRDPDSEILRTQTHQFTRCPSSEDLELQAQKAPIHYSTERADKHLCR